MKNIYILAFAFILSIKIWAQAPQKMSYQAVIRNTSNALITSSPVGMQISILQGSASGASVYSETQTTNTNANGLVSLEIGNGTVVTGTFTAINWANGPYFIKTETDPTGGTAYTISGTSELLSVPYALHAKTAEAITGGITETDPVFVASPANGITTTNITNWNNKLDTEVDGSVTNELQTLRISNDTVYLSNGGFAKLPAGFDGNYNSLINTPTAVSSFSNDAGYLTSFTEVDGSVTNEIQTLRISNDTIYLSNGGYTKLPAGFDGNYNSLTNTPTAVSSFSNDAGYLTSFTEVDGSVTNELQTLRISNDTIYLSNGGFAKLPATNAWGLNGNAGTVNGTNFIGTTDNVALNFKVNNQKAGRIDANSDVFLGYQAGSNNTAIENTAIGFQALQLTNNPLSLANTAVGYKALRVNNGLGRNTAIGTHAMLNNTSGEWNTSIGAASMLSNTSGSQNTALGGTALSSNQTGSSNISIGGASLMNNIAGSAGVAIGNGSQQNANNTTTPFDNTNTSVGYQSLMGSATPASNTGLNNTAIGRESLKSNSTGSNNVGVGEQALSANTTGYANTGLGRYALKGITTGYNNTAVGQSAMYLNTGGLNNSVLGTGGLLNQTSGDGNTAIGTSIFYNKTSGNNNTALGMEAGFNNTTGSSNVFIGYRAGYSETGSNKLYIANSSTTTPLIYGDFTSGNVGIGTTTIGERLVVQGNHTDGRIATFQNAYDDKYITMGQVVTDDGGYVKYKKSSNYTGIGVHGHTEQLVVKGTGAVGIGTTNPLYSLDVFGVTGSPTAATLRVKGGSGSNGRILLADQDVTHGLTDWIATDVFGNITANSSFGGLALQGYSGANSESGVELSGIIGSADPDDSKAAVQISSHKKNGTTAQSLGATETLFGIRNGFSATNSFVVLGNGNVGIGATSPTAKLEVQGSVKIVDGTQATGKILTSDANGLASWEAKESKAYGMIYRINAFDIPFVSTWTNLPLDGGENDLINVAHSTTTNPERITVNVSGTYLIQYVIHYRRQTFPHHGVSRIIKNGSNEILGSYTVASPISGDSNEEDPLSTQVITTLSANDYINLQVATNVNLTNEVDSYVGPDLPAPTTKVSVSITIVKIGD